MPSEFHIAAMLVLHAIGAAAVLYATRNRKPEEPDDHSYPHPPRLRDRRPAADLGVVHGTA